MQSLKELSPTPPDERAYYAGWPCEKLIEHILMLNDAYHQVARECQMHRNRLRTERT